MGLLNFFWQPSFSLAQSSTSLDDSEWAEPINLSHSGSTTNQQLIIDSVGRFNALWVDEFDGYVSSNSSDGVNWSKPIPVSFPFDVKDQKLIFVPDTEGYIHAFWINNMDALFYSRVSSEYFNTAEAWENSIELAESAVDLSVAVDAKARIHLAYIRTLSTVESPSGVYYRVSKNGGANWNSPKIIYQSQYFRSLLPEESSLNIIVSTETSVYVVWDNRPLKLIQFSKSLDEGSSWSEPSDLKNPDFDYGNNIPFGINIVLISTDILITWKFGQPNANCDQYSQLSTDNGNSWNTPTLINQAKYGCSSDSKIFNLNSGFILYEVNIENQPTLLAWNGSEWSDGQDILVSFIDNSTNNLINYRVNQTTLSNNELYVVGSEDGGLGDTWLTSLSLESIVDWFPNPSRWSKPEVILTTGTEISSVSISTDEQNQFHFFWVQGVQNNSHEIDSIYYSKWNNDLLTEPLPIYTAPQGSIAHLDTAVSGDRLLLAWNEAYNDQIYFSWSNTETGQNPLEWSTPRQLSTNLLSGHSPNLLADNSGVIYIAYSKPINEDRGIYLVKSMDNGENWSDPYQVFVPTSGEWDIVDMPNLATNQDNSVYLSWVKKSFPESNYLLGFYTNQSVDQGDHWLDPVIVEEGQLTSGQISGVLNSNLYRIWQEVDISTRLVNWFQFSTDGGGSWSQPTSVTDPEENLGAPIITTDILGRLYLLQPIQVTPEITDITFRIWDANQWLIEDRITTDFNYELIPGSMASAISSSGTLILSYVDKGFDTTMESTSYRLLYSSQIVEIPATLPALEQPVTIEPTQITTQTAMPTISSTPTSMPIVNNTESNKVNQGTNYVKSPVLVIGTILIIVIATILIFYLLSLRYWKK